MKNYLSSAGRENSLILHFEICILHFYCLGSSVVEHATEFSVPFAVTRERKSGEFEEA